MAPRTAALIALFLWILGGAAALRGQTGDPEGEPVLGRAATWTLEETTDDGSKIVEIYSGTRLHERPDEGSAIVQVLPRILLPLVERRGPWARVRYGGVLGWVVVSASEETPSQEAGGSETRNLLTIPAAPDPCSDVLRPKVLDRARSQLGDQVIVEQLEHYDLHVDDVGSEHLLRFLTQQLDLANAAYAERYGLDTATLCRGVVVVFADEGVFLDYTGEAPDRTGLNLSGHASGGVASIFSGLGELEAVGIRLRHEVAHLINHQVLGSPLPAWLDEGLATDFSAIRARTNGRFELDNLEWRALPVAPPALGVVDQLRFLLEDQRRGLAPSLAELASSERASFFASSDRLSLYAFSFLWVRFLLDGAEPEVRKGFRNFLTEVAADQPPSPGALSAHLGRDLEELEPPFERWLLENLARLQLGVR